MKSARAVLALMFVVVAAAIGGATSAEAMVPVAPTFRANQCGQQVEVHEIQVGVFQVCFGNVVGLEADPYGNQAVSFRMTDGSEHVYRVENVDRLLVAMMSGSTKSVYHLVNDDGARTTIKVIQSAGGDIKSAGGIVEGRDFLVPAFEKVFTIQSSL